MGTIRDWYWDLMRLQEQTVHEAGVPFVLSVLALSFVASLVLTMMYSVFFERRTTGSDVHRAFPLLGIAITAVFVTLQYSLPLSLGLLGALSIIRFRTPIKEPEEIGFLMLLIASSLCCATFNLALLGFLFALSYLGLCLLRRTPAIFGMKQRSGMLVMQLSRNSYDKNFEEVQRSLRSSTRKLSMESMTLDAGRCVASYSFADQDAEAMVELQNRLQELVADGEVSVFFHRPIPQ